MTEGFSFKNMEYTSMDHHRCLDDQESEFDNLAQNLDCQSTTNNEVFTAIVCGTDNDDDDDDANKMSTYCAVQSASSSPPSSATNNNVKYLCWCETGCKHNDKNKIKSCSSYCNYKIDGKSHENILAFDANADLRSKDKDDNEIIEVAIIKRSELISTKLKCFSVAVGLLMGGFFQMSSLGITFLVKEQTLKRIENGQDYHNSSHDFDTIDRISLLSLVWSVLTSFIGFLLLYILGSVIVMGACTSSPHKHASQILNKYRRQMEMHCIFGTVVGVCSSWILTDILLGSTEDAFQSALTLFVVLVWVKVVHAYISRCENRVEENLPTSIEIKRENILGYDADNQLKRPLLSTTSTSSTLSTSSKKQINNQNSSSVFKIRTCSFVQGTIIGIFVQRASLSANFLLSAIYGDDADKHVLYTSWERFVSVSVLWSVMVSLMAGLAFFYMHSLTVLAWWVVDVPVVTIRHLTRNIECYFAAGAMIGVNLAWLHSDWILGTNLHTPCSVTLIIAALIWCKLVSYWYCFDRSYTVTLSPSSSTKVTDFTAYAPPRSDIKVAPIVYDV